MKHTVSFTVSDKDWRADAREAVARQIAEGYTRPEPTEEARRAKTEAFDEGPGRRYCAVRDPVVTAWLEEYAAEWRAMLELRRTGRLQHADDEHEADNTGPLRVRPLSDPPPSQ